ncbi:MAG: hypothetical protein LBJ09_00705 [Clostridiales bacterium]|nr:hypothetical protein [Clostridiales bacterium]
MSENNDKTKRILLCFLSVMLLGMSTALCMKSGFGTNSVATLFSGISKVTKLNIGFTANTINTVLSIVIFIKNKKYINIGTIVYAVFMGHAINFIIFLYDFLNIPNILVIKIFDSIVGCFLCFLSVGMFVAAGVGVNPWAALGLILRDKFGKSFGIMKMVVDVSALIIGYLLGGKIGIITIVTAFLTGPCAEKISNNIRNFLSKNGAGGET